MNERPLTVEQIAGKTPVCPRCQAHLIARSTDRRFMENNNYVECLNGHVFALASSKPLSDPDIDLINTKIRGAQLEEILSQDDGVVVSFRSDVPDLFVRVPLGAVAHTQLKLEFGE